MSKAASQNNRFFLAGRRRPDQDRFFKEALEAAGWKAGTAKNWTTCWYTGMPEPKVFDRLQPGMSVNHIPGNNSLTIKSNLFATVDAARRRMREQAGPKAAGRFDFIPKVYSMPEDYHALQEAAAQHPERRWILKPRNAARGKDISLVRDPALVPVDSKWMVQEYLDQPHLLNGHKYVLRLYVLITSVDPLRVYLYEEGSAKLASEAYDPEDSGNLFAHLTNPDINATNTESPAPVVFLSLEEYRRWLRDQGHDDRRLFEQIEDLAALTVIAAREKMRTRLGAIKGAPSGCYELLGVDCLVDAGLKPWIMECNLSPSLEICAAPEHGGATEAENKRRLIADMVSLLGLDRPRETPEPGAPEERIRLAAAEEKRNAGRFQCVVPGERPGALLPCFSFPRPADMVLADAAAETSLPRPRARARHTAELISGKGLRLYSEASGTLFRPNETAAWIWLKTTGGNDPDTIAGEWSGKLRAAGQPDPAWEVRQHVWSLLADWAESGILLQQDPASSTAGEATDAADAPSGPGPTPPHGSGGEEIALVLGGQPIRIHVPDTAVHSRISRTLAPLLSDATGEYPEDRPIRIVQSEGGYAVIDGNRLFARDRSLAQLLPLVTGLLYQRTERPGTHALLPGVLVVLKPSVSGNPSEAALVLETGGAAGTTALQFAADRGDLDYAAHVRIPFDGPHAGAAIPLGLPLYLPDANAAELPADVGTERDARSAHRAFHQFPDGTEVRALPSSPIADRPFTVKELIWATGENAPPPADSEEALTRLLPGETDAFAGKRTAREVRFLNDWLSGHFRNN